MAAGIPQEKAVESLKLYGEMFISGISINDIDYMRGVKELSRVRTVTSVAALGILHALAGKREKAISTFEEALVDFPDETMIAKNYCFMLMTIGDMKSLSVKLFEFASKFETKSFTEMAYSHAYRFGNRDALITYMDKHIKLLSEEEGRSLAQKHKLELLEELDDAYQSTGCTQSQFSSIATIIQQVIRNFSVRAGRFEASKNGNRSYVVEVMDQDPQLIAEMNYALAELICDDETLDGCELTARFSPVRELHTGVSYVRGGK